MYTNFMQFKELNESLDSKFEIGRDKNLEYAVNTQVPGKIDSRHTSVMSSDHMRDNGFHVLRLKRKTGEVEYHLHNFNQFPGTESDNPDHKSIAHAVKIIHDDIKSNYPDSDIHLQSMNDKHYPKYLSLANRLAVKNNKRVSEIGDTELLSIPGVHAKTIRIYN